MESKVPRNAVLLLYGQQLGQPKIWGDKYFDRTVFCLGHRLSKHKMSRYAGNLDENGPLVPLATLMFTVHYRAQALLTAERVERCSRRMREDGTCEIERVKEQMLERMKDLQPLPEILKVSRLRGYSLVLACYLPVNGLRMREVAKKVNVTFSARV